MLHWLSTEAWDRRRWAAAALLALGTLALYARVAGHQFLFFDDDRYVTANARVLGGLSWDGVRWAFGTFDVANWHPLTWLSHMLDVQLFGPSAGAHHLVNAVLHAVNAGLLLLVLSRMTGAPGPSLLVAALFAVHPLHVESVAWVSERKDLLSTLFGLLMLGAYAGYARRPGPWRYLLVALSLAASLLAKPMWVTAPFLLLLLDLWPLQRLEGSSVAADDRCPPLPGQSSWRLVTEKLPLLALSAASSAMAVAAQRGSGALMSLEEAGLGERLANALVSYIRYLWKTLWPAGLSPFYPRLAGGIPGWQVAGAAVLLLALSALALRRLRSSPWLLVGWLWFLGTLVPVIGLVQVGSQAMADRYTYLPVVGLFVAVAWEGARLAASWGERGRRAARLAGWAAVGLLSALAFRQIGLWRDHETIFRHAIAVDRDNGRAHLVLSQGLAARGRYPEALLHAQEAVRLEPWYARAHKNLGFVLYRTGLVDEAIAAFRQAIALQPDFAEAHGNLAIAYGKKGWTEEAMREMQLERQLSARQRRP